MTIDRERSRPGPDLRPADARYTPTTVGEFLDIDATMAQVHDWLDRNPGQIEDAARHGWSQFTALAPIDVPTEGEVQAVIGPAHHRSGTGHRPFRWTLITPTATNTVLDGELLLRTLDHDQTHLEVRGEFHPWFAVGQAEGDRSRDAILYSLRSFLHLVGHRFGLDRDLAADGWT